MDLGIQQSPRGIGIKVSDLDRVDWTQVNIDEWLAILAQTGLLPFNHFQLDQCIQMPLK